MDSLIKKLNQARSAKSLFKDTSIDQLSKIIDNLQALKETKEIEALEAQALAQQEQLELEAMREQIINKGLDFDKLCGLMKPKKKPRKARKSGTNTPSNTYVYDDNKTWDGVGEVPKELQNLLDEGFELSDFIKHS
ncbi:DNA-binding protein H-NS [Vibrio ishigakensis]|uniref:DNA-binding protein H-NS n=1 Tax=Vibrio ishigakensis TaxID=1481914 RepID=A0A0B8PL79_9VIBR|nr:DNA-binding protein H-NS [Vibrio ishigakensis]